ncbi:MAG: alpha/beta hydrolase [Micropepsaceae bacterium]
MRWLRWLLLGAAGFYVAIVGLLYVFQRDLMYRPEAIRRVPPSYYDMLAGVQEVELKTPDGLRVYAWYAPPPEGRPTVAIFHGNGGSLRSQRYRLKYFKDANLGVFVLGYRGHAGSDGTPSEEGLYTDARTALDWLNAQGIADTRIVIYGESLGTGIATKVAAEREFAAVVLESPYTSTVDVAADRFWFVPVSMLMKDRFESLARIAQVHEPLLIMHGEADEVIPQSFGRRLFDAANEPKEGYWPKMAGHNSIFDLGGFLTAAEFIERRVAATPSP